MKIGLALSGGGIRCIAHLGMMQALNEEGVSFDVISGTSAGAIVGALSSNGYSPQEVVEIIKSINFLGILKPALNKRGVLKLDKVHNLLLKYLPDDNFQSLKTKFILNATNLQRGEATYFESGSLIDPILASCSLPVIFDPILINGNYYIDGGVLDNLPVLPLEKYCDFIIGLHCNPVIEIRDAPHWRNVLERSLLMAIGTQVAFSREKCDLFWEAPSLANYGVFDYKKITDIYEIGYGYAQDQISNKAIKYLIQH